VFEEAGVKSTIDCQEVAWISQITLFHDNCAAYDNYMAKKPIIPPIIPKKALKPRFTLVLTLAAAVDAGPEEAIAFVELAVAEFEEDLEGVGVTAADIEEPAEAVGADEAEEVGSLVAAAVLGERTCL
jgi:hypothetical protein